MHRLDTNSCNVDNPDANGMVDWFRIEVNVYLVDEPESVNVKGTYPKVYVYQVIPYKVHVSKTANRNTAIFARLALMALAS